MKPMKYLLFTLFLFCAQAALAVEEGVFSWTAENMAAYRAIASMNPDEKVRNPDYLAQKLISEHYWNNSYFYRYKNSYRDARFYLIDKYPEGYSVYFYANARTHFIDEKLKKELAEGVQQVVILGAGLDSRAYRMSAPNVTFFEVDLPWVIEEKKRRVEKMLGKTPTHVHYVEVDFNTQTLDKKLPEVGYDPNKKTFFLLEGITPYVVKEGLSATFSFVRKSVPGSSLVYDYRASLSVRRTLF